MAEVVAASSEPLAPKLVTLATAANEAHGAFTAAVHDAVDKAVECGNKLLEIKAALQHGEFTRFVADHLSFGIRSAQRYMRAAERPKLATKSDTLSLLTVASVRGAISDGTRDGSVKAVEKIIHVTSEDVADDLIGPEAIANKTTIKKLAEMNPAGIRHATAYNTSLGWRKASVRDSVRRSQQARKRREAEPSESPDWTVYSPPHLRTPLPAICPNCTGAQFDDNGNCLQCRPSAPAEEPEGATMGDMLREITQFARYLVQRYPAGCREVMAHKFRALGDELLSNGDLGA